MEKFLLQGGAPGGAGRLRGADLVSDWFRRNLRIYSNLTRLVDSPNERILVI